MRIADVKQGMRRVTVEGLITSITEPKTVNTRYGVTSVATAELKDDSGSIQLVLWGDSIDMVSVGDKVRVENGYTNYFRGKLQLNVGKYGKLKVMK